MSQNALKKSEDIYKNKRQWQVNKYKISSESIEKYSMSFVGILFFLCLRILEGN